MKTCIQNWLGSSLGIVIDMTPKNFGKHTKDGRILAKLLYNYGALPLEIYNDIKPSKNIDDCYNNLLRLKPWLEYLDVPVQDEDLYEIACSQGTASFHLFYALYLSLQNKDKLHYIAIQKVRRYSEHCNKRKIKVEWVPEKDIKSCNVEYESDLAIPLIEKQPIIDWHREKCNKILENIKSAKKNFVEAIQEGKTELKSAVSKDVLSKNVFLHQSEIEDTTNDLNAFAERHTSFLPNLNYDELVALQNKVSSVSPITIPNFKEAKAYLNSIKNRSKREIIINNFQNEMHSLMIDDMWNNIINRQEHNFEELISKNLLKQSQYEKQICGKLALIRNQKNILLKNRLMIENLKVTHLEKEFREDLNHKMEMAADFHFDEHLEKHRIQELHKRLYMEKVRMKYKEKLDESKSILDKLIDITLRICEFRESFACEIPKHIMKDMKELFFKDLPIFDLLENIEDLYSIPACAKEAEAIEKKIGTEDEQVLEKDFSAKEDNELRVDVESEEAGVENDEYDSMKAAEFKRQEILNQCDFNDYMFLLGPWMVELFFTEDVETEPCQRILGYIVHKMLECKYPPPSAPMPANIKPMNPRSIVHTPNDETIFQMLAELMALQKIVVIRVDDAINFVLKAYKRELSQVRDVDITFQQSTKSVLKDKAGTERSREINKKGLLIKEESSFSQKELEKEPSTKEVAIQTPRNIPEDDPLLSPNADIGRTAFEALGIGDPIPDITVISSIIAYVISVQEEYDGWVLWNYPILYSQASKLECALTGYELMSIEDEMDTVEEIEDFECRKDCQNPEQNDEFVNKRVSKLVSKPETNKIRLKPESYFTSFIKLQNKGDTSNNTPQLRRVDNTEKFYSEQNIFYSLDFTVINFDLVKEIGKIILGESKMNNKIIVDNDFNPSNNSTADLQEKTSVEIFGEGLIELNKKYTLSKKKNEKEVKKKAETVKMAELDLKLSPSNVAERQTFEKEKKNVEKNNEDYIKSRNMSRIGTIPGEPGWEWATGQQKEEIQLALASFWENLEAIFIEDFKTFFFCLRAHRANTLKYNAFLKNTLQSYMRQEDSKQNILFQFQQKFNDIDDDLRPDFDVKCELHVRVTELEEIMCEIADERKDKSENYRIRFIRDQWAADEMTNLVNLYLKALQLEADRCIDTCQFINDYYISLQQKIPQDGVLQKVILLKLGAYGRQNSVTSTTSKNLNLSSQHRSKSNSYYKTSRSSLKLKTKAEPNRIINTPMNAAQNETVILEGGAEAISDILISLNIPEKGNTPFHTFYLDTIENLRNIIKSVVDGCIAEVKKAGDRAVPDGGKDKKRTPDIRNEGGSNIHLEWIAALENELGRFLFRMRLIRMRGIIDFNEFILSILNTLTSLSNEIGEIYNRELNCIEECVKIFRCAIEEEIAIQPRLEMNIDEFIINGEFPHSPTSVNIASLNELQEDQDNFTVEQVSFIFRKLQCIAPQGEIIRRAFIYILEDLRVMKSESCVPRLLPNLWDSLDPNDLPYIFDQIYQRIEIVNWKDFIIYALDIPVPAESELLSMRSAFRSFDQSNTELISYRNYQKVDFWFENFDSKKSEAVKELLFKMYQVNENSTNYTALLLAFCKDRISSVGFVKALALCIGKMITVKSYEEFPWEEGEGYFDRDENIMQAAESSQSREESSDSCKHKQCGNYSCECKYPLNHRSVSHAEEEEQGEAYGLCFGSREVYEVPYTSEISRDALMKVLISSYPIYSQLSILFRCKKTLEQTVDEIFDVLSPDGTHVKAHKLLKHEFITKLIGSTNKFKMVDLRSIVISKICDKNRDV